jgi:hypothetical protein
MGDIMDIQNKNPTLSGNALEKAIMEELKYVY